MKYKAIFIDIDDTLLDYVPCCREAYEAAMPEHPELFDVFFAISGRLFSEAKHGLHTIAEVMDLYPQEFVSRMNELTAAGLTESELQQRTDSFKHAFRAAWGETHMLVEGSKETLEALRRKGYRLFAASNSFGHLQRRRLERAGILPYFEDTFISMDIGYDKPDIRFFEHALESVNQTNTDDRSCANHSEPVLPHESLMVGDSMTTDILGAKAAGWGTCFFNRRPDESQPSGEADYEIRSIGELLQIL